MAKWKKTGERKARGKKTGVIVTNTETGAKKTLLNPHGKYGKACAELESGVRLTNEGEVKVNQQTGQPQKLTKSQKAFRAGYKTAMIDQAKAFNAKNGATTGGVNNGNKF